MTPTAEKTKPAPLKTVAVEARDYIVFAEVKNDGTNIAWECIGVAKATTREQALENIVDKLPKDEQAGTFVAVSARHWKPAIPTVQTITKRTWD